MDFLFWAQFIPVLILLYLHIKRKYSYWANLGLAGPPPSIFKLGNVLQITGQDPLKVEIELQRKYGKVYGIYTGFEPTLTICEPELIKQVLIKDFPLFVNRRRIASYHDMINNSPFFSFDDHWKKLRTVASPTFTTGKLKKLVPIMNGCYDRLERYFTKLSASGGVMHDTRDVFMGFAIETIASTSFAAQTNTNDDRLSKNPFVVNAMRMNDANPLHSLFFLVMPKWVNTLFNVRHPFNVQSLDFFTSATSEILRQCKAKRDDGAQNNLIQLLIGASAEVDDLKSSSYDALTASMEQDFVDKPSVSFSSKKPSLTLTDKEIVGVATGIFIAGFDTTSLTLASCIYELSLAPQLQERLHRELCDSLSGMDSLSEQYYDTVMNNIPYLDAVIKETLRMYPPLARLERSLLVNDYKLAGIPLVKDQIVQISTLAVHYNAEFYPDPHYFNPDRFMPENKHLLVPYAFLPFGDGPRNCVGMRYAYQNVKLCLSRILQKFRFESMPETPRKQDFLPFKFVLSSNPFPIKVVKRV